MEDELLESCTLSPALLELLQMSVWHSTTNTKVLAQRLYKSHSTIDTQFQHICSILQTHSRLGAVLIALCNNWIELNESHKARGGGEPLKIL